MTIDNGNNYTAEDVTLGATCLAWTIRIIGTLVAMAIAWSFSGFWMILIIYLIAELIAGLLSLLASMGLMALLGESNIAKVGALAGNAYDSVVGLFSTTKATA